MTSIAPGPHCSFPEYCAVIDPPRTNPEHTCSVPSTVVPDPTPDQMVDKPLDDLVEAWREHTWFLREARRGEGDEPARELRLVALFALATGTALARRVPDQAARFRWGRRWWATDALAYGATPAAVEAAGGPHLDGSIPSPRQPAPLTASLSGR